MEQAMNVVQAITYQAHAADEAGDTEEASLMEEIGDRLVEMPAREFAGLAG